MKSKFLIVSLALCLFASSFALAQNCATCSDVNPCYSCNDCCKQRCDLFSGLKNLLKSKPCSLNACGPCNAVVACAPCEVACAPACEPVAACAPQACAPVAYAAPACEPVAVCAPQACEPVVSCDSGCADIGCYDNFGCHKDRPVLRAAQRTKCNVSKFFNGLFGSLKGCDCALCNNHGCCSCNACSAPMTACDPGCYAPVSCDPCAPAAACGCGHSVLPNAPQ